MLTFIPSTAASGVSASPPLACDIEARPVIPAGAPGVMSSSGSAGSQLFQANTHPDDPDTRHYAEALTASSNRRMVHIVPSTRLASSGDSARVVRRRPLLLTPM